MELIEEAELAVTAAEEAARTEYEKRSILSRRLTPPRPSSQSGPQNSAETDCARFCLACGSDLMRSKRQKRLRDGKRITLPSRQNGTRSQRNLRRCIQKLRRSYVICSVARGLSIKNARGSIARHYQASTDVCSGLS